MTEECSGYPQANKIGLDYTGVFRGGHEGAKGNAQ